MRELKSNQVDLWPDNSVFVLLSLYDLYVYPGGSELQSRRETFEISHFSHPHWTRFVGDSTE